MWFIFLATLGLILFASLKATGAISGSNSMNQIYQFHWASSIDQVNIWAAHASSVSGVSEAKIKAIMYIESRGKPEAQNPTDPSYGLMALEIPTAEVVSGISPLSSGDLLGDPQFNADTGAKFLAHLERRYSSQYPFSIWAQSYNVGEPEFDRGIRNPHYGAQVTEIRTGQRIFLDPGQLEEAFG